MDNFTFSLGKGLNYFLSFLFNIVLFLVAIARFESPFFRRFKSIRSCACFVRSTFRYVSLKMMRTVGRHFGVVKLVPLRVSSRLDYNYVVLKE